MNKDSSKKRLFEMMNKVSGMPLNEDLNAEQDGVGELQYTNVGDILINELQKISTQQEPQFNKSLTFYLNNLFGTEGKGIIFNDGSHPLQLYYVTTDKKIAVFVYPTLGDYTINVSGNQNKWKLDNNQSLSNLFNTIKGNMHEMFSEINSKNTELNENYPMGAEPEYAGDDAPYNQNDDETNEPDPDEYRDDDMSENNSPHNNNVNVIAGKISSQVTQLIQNQISDELYSQISVDANTFFGFYKDVLMAVLVQQYEKYGDQFNTKAGAAPDEY